MDPEIVSRIVSRCSEPDDFHNHAVNAFKETGIVNDAYVIVAAGLKQYPHSIDLLSDAMHWAPIGTPKEWSRLSVIMQSSSLGAELKYAEQYYQLLKIRKQYWNWRAYDFSIDYLVDRKTSACNDEAMVRDVLREAYSLAEDFEKSGVDPDRAYCARAKVLMEQGERKQAKEYLREKVLGSEDNGVPLAASCIRCIDLMLEDGNYEEVIKVAIRGIAGTAQTQPSAHTGYFAYCQALANDALLWRFYGEIVASGNIETAHQALLERIKVVASLHDTAISLNESRIEYIATIEQRKRMLKGLQEFLCGPEE